MSEATDWDSVTVIRKRQSHAKVAKGDSNINAARREGAIVGVERKGKFLYMVRTKNREGIKNNVLDFYLYSVAGGTNKGHASTEHQKIAKLDRENEVAAPQKIS